MKMAGKQKDDALEHLEELKAKTPNAWHVTTMAFRFLR